MIISQCALLLLFALSFVPSFAVQFQNTKRCGDCWCITDASDGNTCPTDTVGISDTFSQNDELYSTFQLANDPDFLKLQSANGGSCYPFAETMGPIDNYPESNAEQCVFPDEDDGMVCAYVYEPSATSCEGRKYRIQNFPSTNDAMMSNAAILHEGACGVCSTAQDFGARIKNVGVMEIESIKCGTSYTFSRDFAALTSCYQNLGFTDSCSTLWAHFVATNGSNCAFQCLPDGSGETKLNGPAPACEPSECLACQKNFRADFDKIAGIEFPKAGITERIASPCSSFARVIHDPCLGFDSDDPPANPQPTVASDPGEALADEDGSKSAAQDTSNDSISAVNNINAAVFQMAAALSLLIAVTML
jgi:hypothetical protein